MLTQIQGERLMRKEAEKYMVISREEFNALTADQLREALENSLDVPELGVIRHTEDGSYALIDLQPRGMHIHDITGQIIKL
jgi:hypothetical protein